jgi:hypothetical protein
LFDVNIIAVVQIKLMQNQVQSEGYLRERCSSEGNPREDSSSEGFQNQVISKPKNGMVDCLMRTLLL